MRTTRQERLAELWDEGYRQGLRIVQPWVRKAFLMPPDEARIRLDRCTRFCERWALRYAIRRGPGR